jgi:hypothetical protein
MLELYKTDSMTVIKDLKDFITVIFVIVDDIYQDVTPAYIKNRRNSNCSKMSDSEIITISLVGELTDHKNHLTILGDKGYIGDKIHSELEKERNIILLSLKRNNSKAQLPKQLRQQIFKKRRLIEIVNSQFSEQLNIAKVLAKSRLGLLARLETKILAHNICCFINKVLMKSVDTLKIK